MNTYLAEWGGAWSDKSYKHAGSLNIIGPFNTADDAWAFASSLDDHLLSEFQEQTGFGIITGHIKSCGDCGDTDPLGSGGGLITPEQRLRDEYEERLCDNFQKGSSLRAQLEENTLKILDRYWPNWQVEIEKSYDNQTTRPSL